MSNSHVSRVRSLYKLILRLHRSLPDDLKILGDNYAKEEFQRHKKCKPHEAQIFLSEWREYAVNMSRQAAPAKAQRRPVDDQRAGPSREVRAENQQGQATAGGGEAAAAAAAAAPNIAAANMAVGDIAAAFRAGAHDIPRYGVNLNHQRIAQFNPDQLLNLYNLLMTARGENPQGDYANEPIDIGIGLINADIFSKHANNAKNLILQIEKEEKEQLARGEIKEDDITFNKRFWFQMFDEAVTLMDTEELRIAINNARIADRELDIAIRAAENAKIESELANELANNAKAAADNAKYALETPALEAEKNSQLLEAARKAEENAVLKVNEANALAKKYMELTRHAKSKRDEAQAAIDFTKEIWKNVEEDVDKCSER